jgi:pimeloyl-ACP methyl ester carboxylesterase
VRGAALALTIVVAGLVLAAPADAALRFKRCGGYGFKCARLSVPLDRAGALPGRVSLLVKRFPARRRGGSTQPPLFVLAGGPGQSATDSFGGPALDILYPAYARRDLIVFDQRGTGRSGLLRCRRLERANLLRAGAAAGACASSLGPRRAYYTSRDSADDIDAIRKQLGAERIALFGISYGTKLALGYAKRYPTRVERLILDSVVPIDGPDPYYLDSFAASQRALRSLCRRDCSWTGDPVGELGDLVARISTGGPLRGTLVDARGRRRRSSLTSVDLFGVVVAGDFVPTLRAALPGAVHSALGGDAAPLLRLRRRAFEVDAEAPPPRQLSTAVYAATTCEEAPLPWSRETPPDPAERHRQAAERLAAIPDSAFAPFDRATALASDTLNLCERWPQAPSTPDFGPGPLPDVPVLLVEGEDDLRTPVENAERTAELFPRSKVVVAPATGHSAIGSDFSLCAQRAFARFVQRRPVPASCPRGRRDFPPTPPPPRRLADLPRLGSAAGIRGRTLAAVWLTLGDVSEELFTQVFFISGDSATGRGGGLRAGRYQVDLDGALELHGLSFVPGVTVTGRLERWPSRRQHGRLRIGGSATPHGALVLKGLTLRGRLGGRRVRASLHAPSAVAACARAISCARGPEGTWPAGCLRNAVPAAVPTPRRRASPGWLRPSFPASRDVASGARSCARRLW